MIMVEIKQANWNTNNDLFSCLTYNMLLELILPLDFNSSSTSWGTQDFSEWSPIFPLVGRYLYGHPLWDDSRLEGSSVTLVTFYGGRYGVGGVVLEF